jgi:ribonuclease P protein component
LKLQTVKENEIFLKAYRKGKFSASKPVCVYFVRAASGRDLGQAGRDLRQAGREPVTGGVKRLGITVSKKLGSAVVRNRAKRIIRAAFVSCFEEFPSGYDYIIMARPDILTAKSDELSAIFRSRVIPFVMKCVKTGETAAKNV